MSPARYAVLASQMENPVADKNPDPERVRLGRLGGLTASANTEDWGERMAHVRANSPADDRKWGRDLGFGTDPDLWTAQQRRQIKTEKRLYYAEMRQSSVAAIKHAAAARLRARADQLDAEAREA